MVYNLWTEKIKEFLSSQHCLYLAASDVAEYQNYINNRWPRRELEMFGFSKNPLLAAHKSEFQNWRNFKLLKNFLRGACTTRNNTKLKIFLDTLYLHNNVFIEYSHVLSMLQKNDTSLALQIMMSYDNLKLFTKVLRLMHSLKDLSRIAVLELMNCIHL